jgi:hypothetical protein
VNSAQSDTASPDDTDGDNAQAGGLDWLSLSLLAAALVAAFGAGIWLIAARRRKDDETV